MLSVDEHVASSIPLIRLCPEYVTKSPGNATPQTSIGSSARKPLNMYDQPAPHKAWTRSYMRPDFVWFIVLV
jgi:hypothetical protein